MKALFGIGNPGKQYSDTRHNIGFMILDELARKLECSFTAGKGDYFIAGGSLKGQDYILVKPTTYVNRSGIAASDILNNYDIPLEKFLVISDDVNLEVGKIRLRKSGGDGGHNGLASIIYYLESINFPRLRFGIGNNFEEGEMADYVLSPFEESELKIIKPRIEFAVSLAEEFIKGGLQSALDYYSKHNQPLPE